MADSKECRIAIRLSEELYDEIEKTIALFKKKTKVEVSKTNIITSAIGEGLRILQKQIDDGK